MARKGGIDNSVFIFMGVIALIALLVLAFRYFTAPNCPDVGFSVSAERVYAGEMITFTDTTKGAKSWLWHFDDGSPDEVLQSFSRTFYKPGVYKVTLKVNDCEAVTAREFVVEEEIKPQPVDSIFVMPVIEGPSQTYVGKKIQFFDKTPGSTSWEWSFESGLIESKEQNPYYTFLKPGKKTITLIVNGKSQQGRLELTVLRPTPEVVKIENLPPPPKAPAMDEAAMQAMLLKVSQRELMPSAFSKYICDDFSLPVTVNGKQMSFSSYCTSIRTQPPSMIEVQSIVRAQDGCPKAVKVKNTD